MKGIIIINLGSPESPSEADVKRYLKEFLMDKRVIDINPVLRAFLVKGIIAPLRSASSSEAYKSIWGERGSPLKAITEDFAAAVRPKLDVKLAVCMRYGNPTPLDALNELGKVDEILIAPMYPHYAMSSYETALEHVKAAVRARDKSIKIKALKPFYNEPGYISALAASIKPYLERENFDAVMFSYHGIPVRHLQRSDPTKNHCYMGADCCSVKSDAWKYCYKHQVGVTTKLVAEKLGLPENKVILSYQSRLGKGWIEPFTDKLLEELPGRGVKKLLVVCPSFVADCLETLEEINIRGKELFLQNGGKKLVSAACLNVSPEWVETFANYCNLCDGEYSGAWE